MMVAMGRHDNQQNDIRHNDNRLYYIKRVITILPSVILLNVVRLSVVILSVVTLRML
jgi:hypothetical protein